jgi:Holliday junction DNA helicase RuvB
MKVRSDIFREIVGYEDVKALLLKAIRFYPDGLPVHFLLCGSVATSKTLFLLCLSRLKGSAYVLGSRISRSGLTQLLIEKKPHFLCFDEIDKVADRECLTVLLSLMETGRIVETLHGKMRTTKLETLVFATANDVSELPEELLSRFVVLKFKPYKWKEFLSVAKNILVKREKIKPRIAKYIAATVWSKIGSRDFRDALKIARLIKGKQTRKEVNAVLKTIIKYS